ncbi:unnamed protein product [Adineta steineri]|uniref:Heterokaryon incompatibility domain-containing protein n=1 Tax=Adineta steineri TaxID=433720 RepID=A0A813PMD5_9BILA|nr:unnamed protein product [Adineta steineri]CAF3788149.1 unnamed protein product [Adineta steineri]
MSATNINELLIHYEHIWSNKIESYPGRPLRLVNIKSIVNNDKLVFIPSKPTLKYCTVSYVRRTSEINSKSVYFLERISPFTVEGLISAVHVCHELGHDYLWIDALCNNQRSSEEKEREISNMGKYYQDTTECIIFPDGLKLDADILPDGKLPRWFYRSYGHYKNIYYPKKEHLFLIQKLEISLDTIHYYLTWLLRLITDQWDGSAPFKADKSQWNEINRESAFMLEVNCVRKGDILQRAMFRESKDEEDKIYSLLSVFKNVKIRAEYGIGLEEALRRLAEVVTNEELTFMLLTNWFSTNQSKTSSDISALPTFNRRTAAVWFNMGKVHAYCKYIRSKGVQISSKIMECQLRVKGVCTESIYKTISTHSHLEIHNMDLTTSHGVINAYGRCRYKKSNVIIVVIGEFQRADSVLTGAVCVCGTQLCCLIYREKKDKKLSKIGMCICNFDDIHEDQVLYQSKVLLG